MELVNKICMDLTIIFLLIYCIYNIIKRKSTLKELQTFKIHNNTLQKLLDDVQCFKHDSNNIITTIGGYVNSNDIEGLKEYYYQLEGACKNINNLYVLNPNIINNSGVYCLLVDKYKKAEKLNIKVSLEFFLDLNTLKMSIFHFTRILGILIDNAIEAAKDSKEKIMNLYFRNEEHRNRQVVIVENSYKNKSVNIDDIFQKDKTEKENHSGLGLYEVRRILNKNNNLNLYTTKDPILFKQQLEIYY